MADAGNPQFLGQLILNEVVKGTSFTLNQDLPYNMKLIWKIAAYIGDTGLMVPSAPATGTFTTAPQQTYGPHETPILEINKLLLWNCNTDHRLIKIYKRDVTENETAMTYVRDLDAQYDENGQCPNGATPVELPVPVGHTVEFAFIDTENNGCTGDDPEQMVCRRDYFYVKGKSDGPVLKYAIDIGILSFVKSLTSFAFTCN